MAGLLWTTHQFDGGGQLEAEALHWPSGCLYIRPHFRAENSNTARHASEFWMIEPEIAFADLQDDMHLAEAMIKHIVNYAENAPEEMKFCNQLRIKVFWKGCIIFARNLLRLPTAKRLSYCDPGNGSIIPRVGQ